MITNDNYKIEEMEDAAVKKSNMAKTLGVAAGMGVAGAGVAVAANATMGDQPADVQPANDAAELSTQDLMEGANQGAADTTVIVTKQAETPAPAESEEPTASAEANGFIVDNQEITIDAEGNYQASQTTGTLEGKMWQATDTDGDGMVDELYYDADGNGQFDPNEGGKLEADDQFSVENFGQAAHTVVHHMDAAAPEDIETDPYIDPDILDESLTDDGEGISDIPNDIEIESEDDSLLDPDDSLSDVVDDTDGQEQNPIEELSIEETSTDDYASNNADYNNAADVVDFV